MTKVTTNYLTGSFSDYIEIYGNLKFPKIAMEETILSCDSFMLLRIRLRLQCAIYRPDSFVLMLSLLMRI